VSVSAVRLEGVTKAYKGHVAVDNLSLEIPRGDLFGLLGPNGAGKTTTLRVLTNILGPDSGTVEILGLPPGQATQDRIGYMPEERGLYPRMVLEEQLLFLAEIKGTPRAVARRRLPPWLERMGLAEWSKRKVNELSKGMQQKAQFIATVLHDPEVLVLDEPMSGLDPAGASLMRDVLLEMKRQGKTLILSSHQMEVVERLCDSIALIDKGKKLLDGPVVDVKKRYGRNAIALGFEGDGSFVGSLPGVKRVSDEGHFMEIQMEAGADPQQILREVAARLRVNRFEILEPSLRDIFLAQTGGSGSEVAA
jgi:ABC-2 type transport system ATP-binding protein